MRVALLWATLAVSAGLFVVMLLAVREHRAHNTTPMHSKAAVEYGWAIVPWLIFAMGAATQALNDSGWKPQTKDEQDQTGVMIGSGIGGLSGISACISGSQIPLW